ncbi:MAG TPA: phospholipase D-like domain-containing protein, partial [Candidatus Polarisedimenticolia bacterium]|nr:phospholipase D-like domain-containing protein [Candidatus Polarisedimenticolia bacterium]
HNGDDVFIAWKPAGFIPECRGFALLRKRNGLEETVSTWVGFEGEAHDDGERRASTNWPIQKYQWTDYMASPGDLLRYRVIPMIGPDKANLRPDPRSASGWTEEVTLIHQVARPIEVYFNRGIVAAQWVSRRLGISDSNSQVKKLRKVIATPDDPFRNYLTGPLGARLFRLLASCAKEKLEIYAALYELDDEQLEAALEKFGKRAHVVLANGSVKKKGEDQNHQARDRLAGKIDLRDRMISPRALGHNKFLVVCDTQHKPRWVWTGSQNWTQTGLCTQANNSLLIDDPDLAVEYRKQWTLLEEAGNGTPDGLKQSNTHPRDPKVGHLGVRLWFTPTVGRVDLEEARKIVMGAKDAILFLMFNPGPKDTLLSQIIKTARAGVAGKRLYIRGAINQDPSTAANPVELFHQGNSDKADFEVVLPAAIDKTTGYWRKELKKLPGTFAMVHSKVVLVDPFGAEPVVLTGSHNLGPKASGINDENLLIIRDAPGLAAAYATNIMAIYNQYRWRFRTQLQPIGKRWKGLKDSDSWQTGYLKPGSDALREIDFWVGA